MNRYSEILLGGSGGQGLVFISSFLAKAAIHDGCNAAQTQSYGIAQRGGFISAEVIVSDEEILYPQVTRPDLALALHEEALSRFGDLGCPVAYDSDLMDDPARPNWHGLPFTELARSLGAPKVANLVALGAGLHFRPCVSVEAVERAAREAFKPRVAEINIQAVRLGLAETARCFAIGSGS